MDTLAKMTEQERRIIYLAFVEGKTNREIADELCLSYDAVAASLVRSRKRSKKPGRAADVELALQVLLPSNA